MNLSTSSNSALSTNQLPYDGEVYLDNQYFSENEASHYFDCLQKEIQWEHREIQLFGRSILQPRLIAWHGEPGVTYKYSGLMMTTKAWTPSLNEIKSRIENHLGYTFNAVFLNKYRNGHDYMGWHRDNERVQGLQPLIISVSFGAKRAFKFRHYYQKGIDIKFELNSGSLLIMQGETQEYWSHSLPRALKISEPRINLTFRNIL